MIASTTGAETKIANAWSTSLTQTFSNVKLVPVSSVDGKTFYSFGTGSVATDGQATSATFNQQSTATEANGSEASATTAYVLDYVFQLKATNTAGTAQKVAITTLNLTSPLETLNGSEKAFRVATFVENAGSTSGSEFTNGLPSSPAQSAIYAPKDYAYQTDGKAISSVDAQGSVTLGDVTIANSANSIGTISDSTTGPVYYKVWVRLWLEGEDKSCYNDLFLDSGNWSLDVTVDMRTTAGNAASNITSSVSAA